MTVLFSGTVDIGHCHPDVLGSREAGKQDTFPNLSAADAGAGLAHIGRESKTVNAGM
jgi:hypothetical protein